MNSSPYSATGPSLGRNLVSYQSRPLARSPMVRVRYPADQRDAEEHRHRAGDLGDGHVQAGGRQAQPAGQHLQVEKAQRGVQQDLEDRVQRDQHGGHLPVAAGQVGPDQHHRDAAGQADQDDPGPVRGLVRQQQPGQREHHRRADHPVEQQRDGHHPPVGGDLARSRCSGPWPAPGTSSAAGRARSAGWCRGPRPGSARCSGRGPAGRAAARRPSPPRSTPAGTGPAPAAGPSPAAARPGR